MSKDNTQKYRLNLIDVFIIALIVICIFTILLRAYLFSKENLEKGREEYIISFKAEDVRDTSLKYFVEGDTVRIKSKNKVIGKLTGDIVNTPTVDEYTDNGGMLLPNGENSSSNSVTRYTVRGSVIASGKMTKRGLFIDSGAYISPNNEMIIITEHIEITVKIISVDLKS